MRDLVRTNDPVLVSFIEAILRDADIAAIVFDTNMSVLEGSVGVLPRRIAVADCDYTAARATLIGAGLGQWIKADGQG